LLKNVKAGGIRYVEILCIENKAGAWGQSSQPLKADGVSGAEPRRCGDFTVCLFFFQKIRIF